MNENKILVSQQDGQALVDVVGKGTFENATALKDFYQAMIPAGTKKFAINLERCIYLDSTFLGTMAGLGIALKKVEGSVEIYFPSTRNLELIKNLGLDLLFKIHESATATPEVKTEELTTEKPDKVKQTAQILEAHQNLVSWNPENLSKFQDVISFLKEDVKRQSG